VDLKTLLFVVIHGVCIKDDQTEGKNKDDTVVEFAVAVFPTFTNCFNCSCMRQI